MRRYSRDAITNKQIWEIILGFRIIGLSVEPFRHLFGLSEEELAHHHVRRVTADVCPGFPDRIELRDAEPGENLLLVNHVHLPSDNAYRASHAIFVREGAKTAYDRTDEVPLVLRTRLISLRAFDENDMMLDADAIEGTRLETAIDRLLANPEVTFLHAHFAKRGCYAARIERATLSPR